ncbi:hypothetical protein COR50_12900 [Chitinophaga caeni]|uniref:Lipocalin-like domain-containing protein n=1 Tax=Chitinophaga caeni TaxID=2029983 RepID=A0A291R102_9BACT|nr:hypothetical protein [Chitinophaga caeni]ATL49855.1 hypothetical protein COR50_12900 [Chitinophaga caeni]
MKKKILFALLFPVLMACQQPDKPVEENTKTGIEGTWKLVSSKLIKENDTTITYPVAGQQRKIIKIFNGSHFAFFQHDLSKGTDSTNAFFAAGSGTYSLDGTDYKEHLEFCNARGWENNDFTFTLTRSNDTLMQKGVEKIDSLDVYHEIVEIYVKE